MLIRCLFELQGCLFRHDEIEGKGKIVDENAVAEVSWQVEVFAAEAQGRQKPTTKAAYTDMARAAAAYAAMKKKVRLPCPSKRRSYEFGRI